ncbi:unnamed protein product [Dracunculus medinensis]|uniref:Sporulation protein n=1 Tax=Dracunculus medinensis TaxID=318479 RepID=A0A0N4UMV3_DRAME|nr:unnamed protein product [Dracunculus medinensis]
MSSVRTKISMIGNSFRENIAIDVIHIAMLDANISFNRFDNIEAHCELRLSGKTAKGETIVSNNYWGILEESEISERICDSRIDNTLLPIEIPPFLLSFTEPTMNTQYEEITTASNRLLKIIRETIVIDEGEIFVYNEGTTLYFEPGRGIVILGTE